jgi:hypothetical protein
LEWAFDEEIFLEKNLHRNKKVRNFAAQNRKIPFLNAWCGSSAG